MDLENSSNFSVESSRSIVSAIHVNQVGEVAAGGGNQGIPLATILGRVVYQPVLVVFGPAHIPSGPGSNLLTQSLHKLLTTASYHLLRTSGKQLNPPIGALLVPMDVT